MIISTGMSNEVEIKRVLTELDNWNANYALLHCNSTYPASFEDLNLNFIHKLIESSGKIVGYSGHERVIPSEFGRSGNGSENHRATSNS